MTVEEFWEFGNRPENRAKALDLINGEVVEWSRPYRKHGVVCAHIGFALACYLDQVGSGSATSCNAGVILARDPATVVGPDIAYYADSGTEDPLTGWSLHPPALAVEVLSPDDNVGRVNAKIQEYLTNGVKVVWQVDYEERNVTVHRPNRGMEVIKTDGDLTGGEDLPGLSIKVADIFKLPGERGA